MSPSRSEPSRPATAKHRSLAITTPSGRAMPPSAGSAVESARSNRTPRLVRSTHQRCLKTRPPGKCRAAYPPVLRVLPASTAEEAEQHQDDHDDENDPEKAHERVTPFPRLDLVIPRRRRSRTAR